MMDGAHSAQPKRMPIPAPPEVQPKDEDVNMEDAPPGTGDSAVVIDPRGHGRGQTEAQIEEQKRRVQETTNQMWNGQKPAAQQGQPPT